MKKSLLSAFLCLCIVLTLLPMTAQAAYETTDGVATVDNLADFEAALADINVTEIIITAALSLPDGTVLQGGGKTIRAQNTGLDAGGVVQAGSGHHIFSISYNTAVSIRDMIIMGGSTEAVYNNGTLTMENVTVTRSTRGIYNDGNLILKNCAIVRNAANYGGGLLNSGGTVVMDGCSLSENRSLSSSGGGGAAENNSSGKMYVNNSVISNNTSSEIGGAINNYYGELYLMNTTVTGNATTASLSYGGGIGNNGGTLYAVNSIITDNYYVPGSGDATACDIGYDGSNHLYYCVYGMLQTTTLETDSVGNKTDTADIFAGYQTAGILSGDGEMTAVQYPHPVLTDITGGRLYAPLNATNSPAATGGVKTYFDYSDLTDIKMAYGDTPIALGDLTVAAVEAEVTNNIDDTYRVDGVIGAAGEGRYEILYYTVKLQQSNHGTAVGGTVYGDSYPVGKRITVTATPDANYHFDHWSTDGGTNNVSASATYTFIVRADVTLTPVFTTDAPTNYDVTLPAEQIGYTMQAKEGSTSPVGHGGSYTFTFLLKPAYAHCTPIIKVNGEPIALTDGEYTIENISAPQVVSVEGITPLLQNPSLRIKRASLTLESSISINFYVLDSVLEGYEEPFVVFTKALYDMQGNITGYETQTVSDFTAKQLDDGSDCHVYTLQNLYATEMSSAVTATLYAKKDGTLNEGGMVNYSVKQYAANMLGKTAEPALKTTLVDLLNYGAAAQAYFHYNTGSPANADLSNAQKAFATQENPTLSTCRALTENAGATVRFESCALLLEEKVSLNYYLNPVGYTGEISNLLLKVTYTDTDGIVRTTTIDGNDFIYRFYNDADCYIATFTDFNALQMKTPCTAEVFDKTSGSRISYTLVYSIESYAYSKASGTDTGLVTLVNAMMKYGDAVVAYFQPPQAD